MQWIKASQNKSSPWRVELDLLLNDVSSTGLRLVRFLLSFYAPDVLFTF